jgi:hypothetical protein
VNKSKNSKLKKRLKSKYNRSSASKDRNSDVNRGEADTDDS